MLRGRLNEKCVQWVAVEWRASCTIYCALRSSRNFTTAKGIEGLHRFLTCYARSNDVRRKLYARIYENVQR
jgi:hypothetical protein